MINQAVHKGANKETGGYGMNFVGKRDELGLFYKPTILTNISLSCKMWCEETFGSVLPEMKIKNFEETIKPANNTMYGLRTSVYTNNPEIWCRFFDEIQAPSVCINTDHFYKTDFTPHVNGLKTSDVFGGKYFYESLTYMKYR
ncbi:MAG: aldehyde dehydrogenase family protein [Candidatus Thorarchaeota archaeon]